jgi:carboxymethylenebutenolidase
VADPKILNFESKNFMKRRDILLASSGLSAAFVANACQAAPNKAAPSTMALSTGALKGKTVQLDQGLTGYYVTPSSKGTFPAVIVIMEAFGLNDYIKSICDRLANVGYAALAPDFYHGAVYQYSDMNNAIAKLKSLKDDMVMAEFRKGLEFLSKQSELINRNIGVIGFCMGGRFTFLANGQYASQLKAAVSFYGSGIAPTTDSMGRANLLSWADKMTAPIMLMYGAEDKSIAPEEHQQIALALSKAKKRYALNVFPKAGHGFFSDRRDSYNPEASAEAWAMTLSFFDRYLKGQTPKR